jgi:tetratricopeptide (TPR) repeat protein
MIARFTTAFFCLLLLCIAPVSYALAQSKTDSLLNVLEQCKAEDTSRVVALNNLGRHLRSNDPNKAVLYIKEAEKLARKLGFQRELAVSLSGQGLICLDQGKPEEAMTKFKEALSIRESINDVAGIGHIYNNFGSAYETLSEYDSAIVSYEKDWGMPSTTSASCIFTGEISIRRIIISYRHCPYVKR